MRNLHGRDADADISKTELQLGFSIGLALSAVTGTASESDRAEDFLSGLLLAYETDEHYKAKKDDSVDRSQQIVHNNINEDRAAVLKEYDIEPNPYLDRLIEIFNISRAQVIDDKQVLDEEGATKYFVENILDDSFERHHKLLSKLDEEWNTISDASVPGINVQVALEALWDLRYHEQTTSRVSSETIALQIGKKDSYKNTVSHAFNQLSEDGKNPSTRLETTFCHSEIVRWSGSEWIFTDYGRVLAYHVFEKDLNHEWIQRIAIDTELPSEEYGSPSETEEDIVRRGIETFYNV